MTRNTRRKRLPESGATSATSCAVRTWNGLMGLNDEPTKAEPALTATPTIGE